MSPGLQTPLLSHTTTASAIYYRVPVASVKRAEGAEPQSGSPPVITMEAMENRQPDDLVRLPLRKWWQGEGFGNLPVDPLMRTTVIEKMTHSWITRRAGPSRKLQRWSRHSRRMVPRKRSHNELAFGSGKACAALRCEHQRRRVQTEPHPYRHCCKSENGPDPRSPSPPGSAEQPRHHSPHAWRRSESLVVSHVR